MIWISDEVRSRRWKWIGHVLRIEDNSHCRTALTWVPEGRRKVGHPRTTWRRIIVEKERESMEWASWNAAKPIAKDRVLWR